MLSLYNYPPALGVRSASPFCVKAEVLLKMSKLPFAIELWKDPRKAPKKKLPVLSDGGRWIPDSSLIRRHLETVHGVDFDPGLSSAEKAIADAFCKLIEEHLYWVIVHSRWWEEANWPKLRDAYFGHLPKLMAPLILAAVKKEARSQIEGHGMGRHSPAEIYEFGRRDLQSISDFLANKPYFMGETMTGVDATVWGFLHSILDCELPSPLRDFAQQKTNLVQYTARLKKELFSS